jgi:hypothetical protein
MLLTLTLCVGEIIMLTDMHTADRDWDSPSSVRRRAEVRVVRVLHHAS